MAASNQSKITLLYLVYPGMGGLMCDLHAVPRGSQPFHEDAMDKRLCRPPWKPQTDGTIDSWLDGLRDRLSRLYLSVGLVEPKDKPMWCSGKPWVDCIRELVARASHTVVITQSQDNHIYDMLKQGQEPTAFPWRELDSLAQSVQGLHIDRDAFGTKKGVEAMIKATGFRVRQMRPISRTDRTLIAKARQTKERLGKQPVVVLSECLKPRDAHIRRREIITNLPGTDGDKRTIGFVVPYFNACGFESKLRNVEKFLDHYKWMEDRMLVVELAYGDQDFSLTGKTANLLQLRADSVMWHKENLMNLGAKVLRDRGYANVGYLDADLVLDNTKGEDWYRKMSDGMAQYHTMQTFESIVPMFSDTSRASDGAAATYLKGGTPIRKCYRQGGGWVVRGEIWDKCGWYDKDIVGAADQSMLFSTFLKNPMEDGSPKVTSSKGYIDDYMAWSREWYEAIGHNVSYPKGVHVSALPHGAHQHRQYASRERGLMSSNYDPTIHIQKNDVGVWEWTDETTEAFAEWVWLYFRNRQEDGRRDKMESPVKPHKRRVAFPSPHLARKSGTVSIDTGKAVGFVAPYFNYVGYNAPRKNFHDFLKRFEWLGDRLLPVELTFHDRKPEFDYPGMLHVHSDSCMWHKERLINIGCRELRNRGFENVGYMDGDFGISTSEEKWIESLVGKMENHKAVQAFETIDHVFDDTVTSRHGSVAEHFIDGKNIEQCHIAGGSWMVDGGVFDAHGWYDLRISGGGDTYFLLAAMGDIDKTCSTKYLAMNRMMNKAYQEWGKPFRADVGGSVSYVGGTHAFCAPHGKRTHRGIEERKAIIAKLNPVRHIQTNKDGCMEWSRHAPERIKTAASEYFLQRREDG